MSNALKYNPTVCVVGEKYQIMVVTWCEALISVRVGEKTYYNHSNGIRISAPGVHKFFVPQEALDKACSYTVTCEALIDRSPYFPKKEPASEITYSFRPIKKTNDIKIYHLADVHGWWDYAIWASEYFNVEYDLLILNGDISSTSNTFEEMTLPLKIASEITKGEFPCIISRGNHDLRGYCAEELSNYMPGDNGKSYYTFKVGCIWGVLVDTGEDKDDSCPAYGGTTCCHEFRLEQDEMIKNIIKNASSEYEATDVKYKLVISHVPFTFKRNGEFDIERDIYSSWSKMLKENIKPDLMLSGHTHTACISKEGSEYDDLGQPCTIIVGSNFLSDTSDPDNVLAGAFITLEEHRADVKINTKKQIILEGKIEF